MSMGEIESGNPKERNFCDQAKAAVSSGDPWKHRSRGMICATCMWFIRKEVHTPTIVGRCRRHAPTMNGYPVVYDTDWCGDHKVDETKI